MDVDDRYKRRRDIRYAYMQRGAIYIGGAIWRGGAYENTRREMRRRRAAEKMLVEVLLRALAYADIYGRRHEKAGSCAVEVYTCL